jgi:hypothetical protein
VRRLRRVMDVFEVNLDLVKPILDKDSVLMGLQAVNPVMMTGPEGALIRMGMSREFRDINDLLGILDSLSRDLILREAYYRVSNVLQEVLNYYSMGIKVGVDELLSRDSVIYMGSAGSEFLMRFLFTAILNSIVRRSRTECPDPPCSLRRIVFIDEAHFVLGGWSEYRLFALSSPVERLFRESRKYGVSIWLSTQPPLDVLGPTVVSNVGTTVILSGNPQYANHVGSVFAGITEEELGWISIGGRRALVILQGSSEPIRVAEMSIPRELL